MSVIFLGTSNCIIGHSCVQTVQQLMKEEVVNASIGASPCSVGLYVFPDIVFEPGDVAFLDYTITDEASLLSGVRPAEELKQVFATLIADLAERKVFPILLVNPTQRALRQPTTIEDLHLALCIELGVPIFSVSDLFRCALTKGCEIDELMMDAAHHSRAVTPVIGAAMVDAIGAVRKMGATASLCGTPVLAVRRVYAADLVSPEFRRARTSSLRSANFAVIGMKDSLSFDVASDEAVLGFMLNAGAPGANVRLSGECEIITNLVTSHDNRNPNAYMLQFVETRTRVHGGPNGVRLELMPEDATLSEHTIVLRENDRDIYGELHIDGVLIGKAIKAWINNKVPQRPRIDLLAGCYEALSDDLLAAINTYAS